jgi:hypothetical protein
VAAVTSAISSGWAGLIIGLIALVAAEWTILYQKIEPVRRIMDLLWQSAVTGWTWMWENVLKPGFAAWLVYLDILGTAFRWLWDNVLSWVFAQIGTGFQIAWSIFQVVLGLFQIGFKFWGNYFMAWYNTYLKPWVNLLKPVFKWLGEVFETTVLPNMKRGLELIGKAFDVFKAVLKGPIEFILVTILNNGLLAAYNKVAKFFNVKPDDVKIDLPSGFARGGAVHGQGTGTSDSIVARLSNGEHVLTAAEVAKLGGQEQVYRLRSMIRSGLLPGFARGGAVLPGFAAGGPVTKSGDESWFDKLKRKAGAIVSGVTDFFSDPVGKITELFTKLTSEMTGKSNAVDIAVGLPKKVLGHLIDKAKSLLSFGNGDTGPVGAGPGFLPWPSRSPERGGGYGDQGVWRSIVNLIRSTGPLSGSFGNGYRPGDGKWHGAGRAVDWMGFEQDALATFFMNMRGRVLELIHRTRKRDYAITRGRDMGSFNGPLMEQHRNHVHVAMDQGGWLEPGWSWIYNGTGKPEAVLTNPQWQSIAANTRGGDGAATPTYNFQFRDTTLDAGRLRAFQDRDAALARTGRAR